MISRPAPSVVYAYDRSDPLDPRIVASFPVPGEIDDHSVAGDACVYATAGAVCRVDQSGTVRWRLDLGAPGPQAGVARTGCRFAADGTVWVYVPDRLADRGPDDRWLTVDAGTGAVLAERLLDCAGHGGRMVPHPGGELLLDVGEGQDGSRTYRSSGGGFDWTDRVVIAVSPAGDRFLTVDHEQAGAAFHAWPDGAVVARCELGDLEWTGGYLTADTAVLVTSPGGEEWTHHTVDTRTGAVTGTLAVATIDAYDLEPMGDGTFLTTDTDGRLRAHRWSPA